MKYSILRSGFLTCLVWLSVCFPPAGAQDIEPELINTAAEVTYLEGNAFVVTPGMEVIRSLATGDWLQQGERLRVADKSTIELLLPDNSYVRFHAGTVADLKSLASDSTAGRRAVDINMMMGKIWATVSKLFPENGYFKVSTGTSVATALGTIYRMNANEDRDSVVKVYEGEVKVQIALSPSPETPGPTGSVNRPPASESHKTVAAPHPVATEERVYIVGAMQQIVIKSDGTVGEPVRFSDEEDLNDWVRWNRLRDKVVRQGAE